jgi:hypothetical protein
VDSLADAFEGVGEQVVGLDDVPFPLPPTLRHAGENRLLFGCVMPQKERKAEDE